MATSWQSSTPPRPRISSIGPPLDSQNTGEESDDAWPITRSSTMDFPNMNSQYILDKELGTDCALCGVGLGKRKMKPRHHCRICLQAVCNTCSPNAIQFDGQPGTHRACKACAKNAQKAPAMRNRLELVSEKIRTVSGSSNPSFTFAATSSPTNGSNDADGRPQNLEDAVSMCEFATSTLMDAFHSHQSTKLKIQEVEAEAAEQRQARERLESVAQRVDEAENEVADERQARKLLEAKVRLAKNDCVRLAERLCSLNGAQGLPSRTSSLEDAMACCDSALVRMEAVLDEERRQKKEIETEKQEALAIKERQVASMQAELMKLRADAAHERKLREAVEDSVLHSISSRNKSSAMESRGSLSPPSSMLFDAESDRILYLPSTGLPSSNCTPARTPPRMHSVHEDVPSSHPSTSDLDVTIESRPSCSRMEGCKTKCAVM